MALLCGEESLLPRMKKSAVHIVERGDLQPRLEALPDESLFSLCSRHHRLWGYGSASSSCSELFGSRRAGVHHDFPSALGEFERLADGAFGGASDIALQRTILKFYVPFSQSSAVQRTVAGMTGPSVAHLKFGLGLLTSRFRANHPLKACEYCLVEDAYDHGWAYWHLEHQFPGVWTCCRHRSPLLECTVKANGIERFMWHLPRLERLQPTGLAQREALAAHRYLSDLVNELVNMDRPPGWLHASNVLGTLRARLRVRDWLTHCGHLRLAEASRDFRGYLTALDGLPELSRLDMTDGLARNWVERVARPLRSGTHPLRLLLAIHWLFESPDDFVESHDKVSLSDTAIDPAPRSESHGDWEPALRARKSEVARRLQTGESSHSVALALGVDIGTVMAWGAQAGIAPRRRPKSLVQPVRVALIAALKAGLSKKEAAASQDVTVQSITRLLRTEPGLSAAWQTASRLRMQRERRNTWEQIFRSHPHLGAKLLRAMNPASYSWLYRNDREWLLRHSPSPTRRTVRRSSVRWDDRDTTLSSAVRHVVLNLHAAGRTKPLKLWEVVQQLPELKAKLGALRRLPLTARALEDALGRPTHQQSAYFSPSWTPFQADRGRCFSGIVDGISV